MIKKCFLILFIFWGLNSFAQDSQKLILNFPVFDYSYSIFAAKTVSNSVYPNYHEKPIDFLKAYVNPSMTQSLESSASFYNAMNFGLSKMKIKWFDNAFWNYMTESLIFSGALFVAEYIPLGDAWLHEEFHRAVLTKNYVNSYNQVNDFPFFAELVSVNNVTDDDLIRFKSSNQSDFVRLHAAGIEGENLLIRELQKRTFFSNQQLPYFSYELLWTTNSFYYVWVCHTEEAEITTKEVNEQDADNLKIRDFTGLDFTAWVYDLFKPQAAYENRGVHPSGVGIDRYIKPSDLTSDELSYLKKQGYLQLLNFASPMLLSINHIPITIKGLQIDMNFAFRHYLTSFGNDISFDLLIKYNDFNLYNIFHFYSNKAKTFPGFETSIIDYDIKFGRGKLKTSARTMIWVQPENLLFQDIFGSVGGLCEITLKYGMNSFFPYLQMGGKTSGWVAGNEFQNSNAFLRFGLSWYIN